MREIEKVYESKKYEEKIYKSWEKSGFFNPDNLAGKPYSIMMPPPNVTGVLHLGHALENSLMDVMARYQRLRGKKVLLLPGTDHAAVATQAKVEKLLQEKGIKNPRVELSREGLLKEIRQYAEKSKSTILSQIKRMGTSCDWSRLAYTFDEKRNGAVRKIFKKMYYDGLIYRGFRAINWSVLGQSTLSDDEIVYTERKAKLYTFRYSADFPFAVATTRPETKLGDTAVAVNPNDKRYKKYIGKTFDVDFLGQKLQLKIIAEKTVAIDFGTGVLGVTPAHSMIDYEMAVKNNLPIIRVIGEDGKMTKEAGDFVGMSVEEAREEVVKGLKKAGLFIKEEDIEQNVGTSDRFGDIVEVLPKEQWFVAVDKKIPGKEKSLKQLMKEAVKQGIGEEKVKITPKRFEKIYFNWIDNLRDWCISRQIWWGHQIPVWYHKPICIPKKGREKDVEKCVDIIVSDKEPICKFCNAEYIQDPDTLDTWFSSGLWTFSTLGWPLKTKDLKIFHPTSWMQMGHEILFFWMARMILMSEYALGEIPFKNAYIHGILRDERGKKFSKSLGNSIDPLEVIDKYGTDALRFSLLNGVTPGQDQRFYYEKVEAGRNLVNKIWNISRFILTSDNKSKLKETLADKWILSKFNNLVKEVTEDLENYNFSQAVEKLREVTWSDFADWYLEVSKVSGGKYLKDILEGLLILWHPYIPYVTEAIWCEMLGKKNLIVAKWPKVKPIKPEKDFEKIKGLITKIRNMRAENKLEPKKIIKVEVSTKEQKLYQNNLEVLEKLSNSKIEIKKSFAVSPKIKLLVDEIDREKSKKILEGELEDKENYQKVLDKKLSNKAFVSNAPEKVVIGEREKLEKVSDEIKQLKNQLKNI